MRRLALPALLVMLLPLGAAAQGSADTTQLRISPAIGIHYGVPLRLSLAAGGLFDFRGSRSDGVIAMAEPGQGGVELSLGYFRTHRFGQGYSLRLAGIRTGEDPWNTSAHTTYIGAELHWMLLVGVGGRAGWFRRASAGGASDPDDNLGTLGVSIGW
ncbi:MAG: hypothetical protein ABI601_14395 [bacterium]